MKSDKGEKKPENCHLIRAVTTAGALTLGPKPFGWGLTAKMLKLSKFKLVLILLIEVLLFWNSLPTDPLCFMQGKFYLTLMHITF